MTTLTATAIGLSRLTGGLLVISGALGLAKPLSVAPIFGIPSATPAEVTFYPALAVRNLAAGLAVSILSMQARSLPLSERRIVYNCLGTLLICWSVVGLGDTHVLNVHPKGENKGVHLFNVCWVFGSGWVLRNYVL